MQSIRTIAIITSVGVLLTASTAIAKNSPGNPGKDKTCISRSIAKYQSYEERIESKVAEGKITQDEADKMLSKRESKKAEMIAKAKERVEKALSEGTIDPDKAEELIKSIEEGKIPFMGKGCKMRNARGNEHSMRMRGEKMFPECEKIVE